MMLSLRMMVLFGHILDITSARNRPVRIVNGEVIEGRTTGYDAVRYFAQIATVHRIWWFGFWPAFVDLGIYGTVVCGGALITPGIVQTACHCLTYAEDLETSDRIQYPEVKHNWESTYVVYVGVNREFSDDEHQWAMDKVNPLISKKFVVHQACGKLPTGTAKIMTHDFAWVCIDPNWNPEDKLFRRVSFAPLYTTDELDKIWDLTKRSQFVCLIQGFGGTGNDELDTNRRLRHGWTVVISYGACVSYTGYGLANVEGHDLLSWLCTVPTMKYRQTTGEGDSGSPVTCNNLYVAVVLGRLSFNRDVNHLEIKNVINLHSGLKFAPFENARAYRKAFIQKMAEYAGTPSNYDRLRSVVGNIYTNHAFTPAHQHHIPPHSHSSSTSKALPFFVLLDTLVKFAFFH